MKRHEYANKSRDDNTSLILREISVAIIPVHNDDELNLPRRQTGGFAYL